MSFEDHFNKELTRLKITHWNIFSFLWKIKSAQIIYFECS